jgi:hypothetical protein
VNEEIAIVRANLHGRDEVRNLTSSLPFAEGSLGSDGERGRCQSLEKTIFPGRVETEDYFEHELKDRPGR